MKRPPVFLTAEWKNLLMLNYAVDPSLLHPFVPAGTELDSFAGKTYVSLIGFQFNRTRLRGLAIPFHQAFEEVNLRFYVRRSSKRGAVFISELVPKFAVAAIARWAFNEKYSHAPMAHRVETNESGAPLKAEYVFGKGKRRCALHIETNGSTFIPEEGSLSQFITEHYWGYAAQKDGSSKEYEVEHPQWQVSEATSASFTGDAAWLYGNAFAPILLRPPDSAFLAVGSSVTVYKGQTINR